MKYKLIINIFTIMFLVTIFNLTDVNASEELDLIDIPTAAVIKKGNYQINTRLYTEGGVLVQSKIGLGQRFNLGISYGGTNIISSDDPVWNSNVAISFRYRLTDGGVNIPAMAIGYDAQGFGNYYKKSDAPALKDGSGNALGDRYRNKSKGFYLVMTQELKVIGGLNVHGGANYSFEDDDDKSGTLFAGVHKQLGPEFVVLVDYDLALNDDADLSYGDGLGYLNAGVRWYFAPELSIEFDMLNLTGNGQIADGDKISRIIKINYTNYF